MEDEIQQRSPTRPQDTPGNFILCQHLYIVLVFHLEKVRNSMSIRALLLSDFSGQYQHNIWPKWYIGPISRDCMNMHMACYPNVTCLHTEMRQLVNETSHRLNVLPLQAHNNSFSEEQPVNGTMPERKRLSVCICVCVTSATVANRHRSEQRTLKHLQLQPLFGFGIFENLLSPQKLRIELFLFSCWIFLWLCADL